jgi:serine/threonine protein kinase
VPSKPTGAAVGPAGDDTSGFDLAGGATAAPKMDVPSTLGGYQMLKELGRGGMGAVYLARQISLDRNVAVKVMRPEWTSDPIFVARFTREAFAAAQLVHHNVVQIHDIGAERDTNFFSMEFVEGESLGDIVKREGKLDAEVAVGYMLQAARGLALAHEQGMVHRDIKPDNLMLNRHGIIKVADLGIVKTPGAAEAIRPADDRRAAPKPANPSAPTHVTMAGIAMGTPTYMAPEQARDASKVDARADIYSLGCTLYVLVTGRPPFEGKTAVEVITKHASHPIVPPEAIVKRVPKALSEIILKMVAKRPEDRYQTMQEVVKSLEKFLGIEGSGPFSPREEHAQTLEEAAAAFRADRPPGCGPS